MILVTTYMVQVVEVLIILVCGYEAIKNILA